MTTAGPRLRPVVGDVSGAVADLGILVPLVAALILVNGLHPAPVLLVAGALSLAAGLYFRVPMPVQPLKALTALAVAQGLAPEVIHAAGLLLGLILMTLAASGLVTRIARAFTRPVIRSVQLAVGVLLIRTAWDLAVEPPELFAAGAGDTSSVLLALATLAVIAVAVWRRWYAAAAALVAAGTLIAWVAADPVLGAVRVQLPGISLPPPAVWGTAFVTLVIPQLPLTYGNAVVGMADLAREQFPEARRMRASAVAVSCGAGNVVAALLGGMPMCHGSSGFTAHVRLGARTAAMNVLLGSSLLILGLVFSDQVLVLFSLLPVWALAGFLAYAGLRHALLVLDLRGATLGWALIAAALGVATSNLAVTTAVALAVVWGPWLVRRLRPRASANTR